MTLAHPSRHQPVNPLVSLPDHYAAKTLGLTPEGLTALVAHGAIEELTPGRISVDSMRRYAETCRQYQLADQLGALARALSSPGYYRD